MCSNGNIEIEYKKKKCTIFVSIKPFDSSKYCSNNEFNIVLPIAICGEKIEMPMYVVGQRGVLYYYYATHHKMNDYHHIRSHLKYISYGTIFHI